MVGTANRRFNTVTAFTPLGIPYPDDYSDPADSPAVMEASAVTIDTLISGRAKVFVQSTQPTGAKVGDIWAPT